MADVPSAIDPSLEDGELSGSDSDSGMRTVPDPPVFSGSSFQSRTAVLPSITAYRSAANTADSSDPDSDEEAAALWCKRQKMSNTPRLSPIPAPSRSHSVTAAQGTRKINNIWGSVVQEQCQEAITAELGVFGMEGGVSMSSRSVETYNYVLARKMRKDSEEQQRSQGESMLDTELEEYMAGQGPNGTDGGEVNDSQLKRKRPAKERLGPRAEMDIQGRYEITEEDPEETVIDEIRHRLREPKKELLERVVKIIGRKKAIELLWETATVEESGGLYTIDGSRRRTPGGVFLNLLKNTPSITKVQYREIFLDENQRDQKSKKAAQKRRRHLVTKKMKQVISTLNLQDHDDVSRETFASDTNEALESLDEVVEEDQEEKQPEPPLGIEETAIVYNSADLEVF